MAVKITPTRNHAFRDGVARAWFLTDSLIASTRKTRPKATKRRPTNVAGNVTWCNLSLHPVIQRSVSETGMASNISLPAGSLRATDLGFEAARKTVVS